MGDIERLQRIHNRAAWIVLGRSRYESATPLLKQLHWLPVNKRIIYKVSLMVFKCLNKSAPCTYLYFYIHQLAFITNSALQMILRCSDYHVSIRNRGSVVSSIMAPKFGIPSHLTFAPLLLSLLLRKNSKHTSSISNFCMLLFLTVL